MIRLFKNNRNPLTLLTIIITFALMYLCYCIENQSSTIIQWIIFVAGLMFCIYLQFSDLEDDIEWSENDYDFDDKRAEKIIQEQDNSDNVPGEFPHFPLTNEQANEVGWVPLKPFPEGQVLNTKEPITGVTMDLSHLKEMKPIKKTIFVVQPINITEHEFNEKINQNNNMETNKQSAAKPELESAPKKEQPIVSYSLHGIPQKWRAMVDDICSYATRGEKKKLEDIKAKIAVYGQPYKTETKYHNLVAFKFDFIRIPVEGYFGIKTKEDEETK